MMIANQMQNSFVEPVTPLQEGIILFHNELMVMLVFVVVFVGVMIVSTIVSYASGEKIESSSEVHGVTVESGWTLVPGLLLAIVTVPSFALLYSVEDLANPSITINVTGKQWYWVYEYLDVDEDGCCVFDSYMLLESDLKLGELRLLDVDHSLQLPSGVYVSLLVTAADVLHSFAVPSFGINLDAIPGSLNEIILLVEHPGTYYGQCSELCGVNHAFMPIGIDVVNVVDYANWYYTATTDYWVANWSNWDPESSIS